MTPIVEKLKKLIAHEQSARTIGNTAEAESFATKIQEMLVRHKLSMSEVEAAEQDQTNPIGAASSVLPHVKAEYWAGLLAEGVAQSLYCEALLKDGFHKQKGSVVFVGRESDREAAATLFNYLYALGAELAQAQVRKLKADERILNAVERRRLAGFRDSRQELNRVARIYKRDFLLGYATALYRRLLENKKNLEGAADPRTASLIVRDAQLVQDYCHARFEVNEHRPRAPKPRAGAFRNGYAAGQNVSLTARAALSTDK